MREEKYARHWRVLMFILDHQKGKKVDEIAREVGTTTRTVRRDLQMLEEAGFPIVTEKLARGTVFKVLESFSRVPPVPFTQLDAVALMVAKNSLLAQGEAFMGEQLQDILRRLIQRRPEEMQERMRKLEQSVLSQPRRRPRKQAVPGVYDQIADGITRRRILEVDYRNAGGEVSSKRRIAPVHLLVADQVVYLRAWCYAKSSIRTFVLSRFLEVRLTDEVFKPNWDYDAESVARDSFGVFTARAEEVVLEFDDILESYFAVHPLHASQEVSRVDGSLRMGLQVGVNESLIHQLLGFGCRVRVLKPLTLAHLLAERHREAASFYAEMLGAEPAGQGRLPLAFEVREED